MLLLMEITYTDKESQALYSNYTTETELIADVETKLGQAMKSEAMKAEYLLAFDHTGRIIKQAYHSKEDVTLSNRLIWVTSKASGEEPNLQKYSSQLEAEANYHTKRGDAMKDPNTLGILTTIVNGNSVGMSEYWVRTGE